MKKIIIILVCFHFCIGTAYSQQEVMGRVITNEKIPLAGALIKVDSLNQTTTSDGNGRFKLKLKNGDISLTISSIGFKTQRFFFKVPIEKNLLIVLEQEVKMLNDVEIINTGYQVLPKERTTGSITFVNQELFNRNSSSNVLARLEYAVPGLVFNKGRNNGSNTSISIRGQSTLFGDSQPLIVLDNFPFEGDIETLNPDDVENVTVLKDAAAASIWGARAGNGVIVITTKKGALSQQLKTTFNSTVSTKAKEDLFYKSQITPSEFIEIESQLFAQGYYKSSENSLSKPALTPAVETLIAKRDGLFTSDQADAILSDLGKHDVRDDFNKYFYRHAIEQQYNAGISKGSNTNSYAVNVGWNNRLESGIGNSSSRITLNASNRMMMLKDKLDFNFNFSYTESRSDQNNVGTASIRMSSTSPLYPYAQLADSEGNPISIPKTYREATLASAEAKGLLDWHYKPLEEIRLGDNKTNTLNYRLNVGFKYKIIQPLNMEVLYQYGKDYYQNNNLQSELTYYTRDQINKISILNTDGTITRPIPLGGILDKAEQWNPFQNFRTQLNFAKINKKSTLNAIAGYEIRERKSYGSTVRMYGYDSEHAVGKVVDYLKTYSSFILPTTTNLNIPNIDETTALNDRYLSYYANMGYLLNGKYALNASARIDKSNLFGVDANQKGVPLYSVGLGWILSEEDFYTWKSMPFLKLRVTYGYNGNVNKSLSAYTTASYNSGISTVTKLPYAQIVNPPNPELRWERVKILNFGVDFNAQNQRIGGSIEFYKKNGIDLIGVIPYPASTGVASFRGNHADTKGTGMDISLNTNNLNSNLKWVSNFIFSYSEDIVSSYKINSSKNNYLMYGDGGGNIVPKEGKPLFSLYSYKWAGLDPANGDPIGYAAGLPSKDYAKIITGTPVEDLVFNGTARPKYFGSARNTFTYKRISLSANISYRFAYFFREESIRYSFVFNASTIHGDYTRRWKNPGDELLTNIPSMPASINASRDDLYTYSEALVKKGDNIRLQDIRMGYDFFARTGKPILRKAQLFVFVENVGILWKAANSKTDPDYPSFLVPLSVSAGIKIEL